ncbi:endonuclease domain-containing protein [Micromonospora citrea]|uniref:endonuclease domain-containing protein n=1 Tax=Micromonospora citrea TaxID=47855 RepID=UPI003C5E39E0
MSWSILAGVHPALRSLVERGGGVVTRRTATQVVPGWVLRHSCLTGALRPALPGVYVDAALLSSTPLVPPAPRSPLHEPAIGDGPPDEPRHPKTRRAGTDTREPVFRHLDLHTRRRVALAHADGRVALSSVTALDVWGLRRQLADEPTHLDTPRGSGLRPRPLLAVHHRHGLTMGPPDVVVRGGVPVVRLERALVDAWPLLPPVDRAAPVIRAVNDRLTTPERIRAALATAPRLADRAQLRALLARLDAGCRSPLEVWGHDHVFTGPGMPVFRRQARVVVGRRVMYLDVYAERERVDFELDGATTHGDPRQREVDLRRDALLATVGVLVVRFAHRRLVHEPEAVRREVLAILASRRRDRRENLIPNT